MKVQELKNMTDQTISQFNFVSDSASVYTKARRLLMQVEYIKIL